MSSSLKSLLSRVGSRLGTLPRRVFFWIPKKRINEEEHTPVNTGDHKLIVSVRTPRRIPRYRQIRYADRVLSSFERKSIFVLFGFILLSIGTTAGLVIKDQMERIPVAGGTLTEALIGEPSYINPLNAPVNDVDKDLTSLIFSGLYRLDGMTPILDLAEKAEWSDDRKTLTVTLRQDAYFQSGDQVLAEDVLYTIDAIEDPAHGSSLASKFRGVQTAIVDKFAVQFTLENPNAFFEYALTVGILPSRLWQEIPAANARLSNLNLKPIGSGPYRFKSFTRDSKGFIRAYTLERFEDYYGEKPFIKTLVLQFYPDRSLAEEALKADLVDALAFSPVDENIRNSPRWTTVDVNLPQETIAFLNLKNSILKNEAVRKALINVVDRQEIVDAWKGHATPINGPLPFEEINSSAITLDEARNLLDEAGWKLRGTDSIRSGSSSSSKLEINILTSNMPALTETAETLKRRWSLLGAQVNVESVTPEELLRRATRDRNADIIITNILLDPTQDLFPFWWSGQATDRGFNISNLSDRDVDTALENLQKTTSPEKLSETRKAAADKILEAYAAVFLVRPESTYLISKKIKEVDESIIIAQPSDRFSHLQNWYIKKGWRWKKDK